MPFGRLGRHGNRSQHALPILESASGGVTSDQEVSNEFGAGAGSSGSAGSVAPGNSGAGAPQAASATASAPSSSGGAASANPPHPASPSGFSSNDSLDSRPSQQQQQQQQQQQHQRQQSQHTSSPSSQLPPQHQHLVQNPHQLQHQLPLQHQDEHDQHPPPPPPHHFKPTNRITKSPPAPPLHNQSAAGGQSVPLDPRLSGHDLSAPVTHPHHYPPPLQHPSAFSDSVEDLQQQIVSPTVAQSQAQAHALSLGRHHSKHSHHHPALPHLSQQQQPPPPQPEQKRSARKIIRGIFTSSSSKENQQQQQQQQQPPAVQSSYDNTSGLARRPSKRISNAPNFRYSLTQQVSQLSVDQDPNQPADWQHQQQHQQHQQHHSPHPLQGQAPSPLAGVGELDEESIACGPDVSPQLKTLPNSLSTTIRQVHPDLEAPSPYPSEEIQLQQHQQQQLENQHREHPHLHHPVPSHQHANIPQFQLQQDPTQQHVQGNIDPHQQQQPPQQFSYPNSAQGQQYQSGLSQLHTGHLPPNPLHHNPETSSQVSRESPVIETVATQHFQSSQISPAATFTSQSGQEGHLPPLPVEAQQDGAHDLAMQPAPTGVQPQRQSQEGLRPQEGQVPAPPPNYRHSQAMPPQQPGAQQSQAFRGATGQDRMAYDGSTADQGRNSPQPEQDPEKAFRELLVKYKNVKRLYFDNKAQIEQMTGQIEHLQNAVANQRISQSRTALDDSEYATRFNRLNGAINNLSFNIRKDWRMVPRWLDRYVRQDAIPTGKQEMTAVGRAVITRWIVEEVFNRCFHPGLDPTLSRQLKEIELNIRRNSYTLNSQEEFDALTAKVISWRMATLEGLSRELSSPESADHRAEFTRKVTANLLATLMQYLKDPPPPGVDGSASMIMELAVGIAANLPLESRDVVIRYPLPGDLVEHTFMEVEKQGLPALDGQDSGDNDEDGDSGDGKETAPKDRHADRSRTGSAKDPTRVRLAGFIALEVRGRQVLMKAPVWTLG
ncbi:hypothetical protein jhhlp_002085 [Lomentospora prolificans]|uniref:S-adenosylmethionine-dependent methyltransferase-like protein n=1 Tax=Lomentospora prolificans TaxID=41688 RepID=A0A2N3ND08_9PEZI|nr:hypothetical protein jhhlp_002085 [Lomentospora prolificans]